MSSTFKTRFTSYIEMNLYDIMCKYACLSLLASIIVVKVTEPSVRHYSALVKSGFNN